MRSKNLNCKVALVTGASSGIGKGCAISFAEESCYVAIAGRNEEALKDTSELCQKAGLPNDKVLKLVGDLSKEEDAIRVVEETLSHFGKIDILVNSAEFLNKLKQIKFSFSGILVSGGIEKVSLEDYDRQMNINTRSLFHLSKLCLPHLIKTKGNIVNISSVTGLRSFPGVVAYNMSKAAVDHLTRSVALEVADRGVRVNAVNPGVIITDVHRRGGMDEESYKKFLEHGKETHAMGRVGDVEEVADVVVFLASDNASFITGATIPIDGGRHAMCPR